MSWTIVGLGNPGAEYDGSRHNVGRDVLRSILKKESIDTWKDDKTLHAQSTKGTLFGKKIVALLPDTYMNNSGRSLSTLVTTKKAAEQLIVLQDELDLPLGRIKLSFGSSSGGHRGIESIQRAIKTKDFIRVRIGICPATPKGKAKKPDSDAVVDFVLGKFRPAEKTKLAVAEKNVTDAIELILTKDLQSAMTVIHSR